jgi:hypothetical protein
LGIYQIIPTRCPRDKLPEVIKAVMSNNVRIHDITAKATRKCNSEVWEFKNLHRKTGVSTDGVSATFTECCKVTTLMKSYIRTILNALNVISEKRLPEESATTQRYSMKANRIPVGKNGYTNDTQPSRWTQYISPKSWYHPTSLHGATIQKTNIDIFTAVRTSNLIRTESSETDN